MRNYLVEVDWSGYSRGVSTYRVEAHSVEEAEENWYEGEELSRDTIRDDTEKEGVRACLEDT